MGVVQQGEEERKNGRKELTTVGVLAAVEAMDVGAMTLSKVAMTSGMNNFVFVVYTQGLGVLIFIPLSILFHRRVAPPPLTLSVLLRIVLLSVLGYCTSLSLASSNIPLMSVFLVDNYDDLFIYLKKKTHSYGCSLFIFIGVEKSSPTLASAILNLSPAFTFILAILFRMEALDLRVGSSLFKFAGTILSITGAFVVIFYQGWPIFSLFPPDDQTVLSSLTNQDRQLLGGEPNWILGGFLVTMSTICVSLILIVKAWILRDYPSEMLLGLLSFSLEAAIGATVAQFVVQDSSDWKIGLNTELLAIVVMAILVIVVENSVHSWGCRTKGAVYVAMFKPLQIIVAILLGIGFLGDTLHFGSVVGGTTIVLGFYTVMKGKAMEENGKLNTVVHLLHPSDLQEDGIQQDEVPLLLNKA